MYADRGRISDRGGGNKGKSSSESKSNINRYNCKEKGHFRRYCPLLKKGNNGVGPSNNNVVVVQGNFDEGDDGEVLTVCTSSYVDA